MPHRITCYSRAYFTNIPNHKIVYAVKNIVKEEIKWSQHKAMSYLVTIELRGIDRMGIGFRSTPVVLGLQ